MSHSDSHSSDLQPRAQRRRKKSSTERGLASDADLTSLARAYLQLMHRLWPQLVKNGVLPAQTDEARSEMVAGFKSIHQTGYIDFPQLKRKYQELLQSLAAIYARFSCDNSSPNSIVDQMVNALQKASEEGHFVPWEFVFADYAVSGLDSTRLAYQNCKSLIEHPDKLAKTIYIDDFTRASRDAVEWWNLAYFCKQESVGMIGASDGFDLSSGSWDIHLTVSGLVSRLQIKSLREKVGRGMQGAARRGTCLGKPPMGFTRKLVRNQEGSIATQTDGTSLYTWAVDPVSSQSVKRLFELFVVHRKSAYQIARIFNQQKVDGTDTWSESSVKKMLRNQAYIGTFIWNRKHRELDYKTKKWKTKTKPEKEWIVRHDETQAIIAKELWEAAQELLSANKRKPVSGNPVSRNQVRASTLFSGTLSCEYCDRELQLTRSAGEYKSMACLNGATEAHGCKLRTSKSTRVIEECLLAFVNENVVTEAALDDLVDDANAFLKSVASKPKPDLEPLRSEVAKRQKKNDSLMKRVENLNESQVGLLETYERQILRNQKEIDQLRIELQAAELQHVPVPPKLTKKALRAYLPQLRAILNQEIPVAAEALRQLTGPISIRQEAIPGKARGARWIATFSPNLLALLRHITQGKDCPDSVTLEYLYHAIWTKPATVTVPIEDIPRYEQLAPKFKAMRDKGASIQSIAAAHGTTWSQVRMSLTFADTGVRPEWPKKTRETSPMPPITEKYQTHSAEVVRRRKQGESFAKIARELGIAESTARRAWDHAHRDQLQDAVSSGETPSRGRYRHLSNDTLRRIQLLLKDPRMTIREIAATCCVSQSTVRREKLSPRIC